MWVRIPRKDEGSDGRGWAYTPDTSGGAWLKRIREEKGITFEYIHRATRIPIPYLQSFEQNARDSYLLLGEFHFRSYLRQYSSCVGLDPDLVFNRFRATYFHPTETVVNDVSISVLVGVEHRSTAQDHKISSVTASRPDRARKLSRKVFSIVEMLVPKRLAREELGDAEEYMHSADRTAGQIFLKMVTTVIWILVNTARYIREVISIFSSRPDR